MLEVKKCFLRSRFSYLRLSCKLLLKFVPYCYGIVEDRRDNKQLRIRDGLDKEAGCFVKVFLVRIILVGSDFICSNVLSMKIDFLHFHDVRVLVVVLDNYVVRLQDPRPCSQVVSPLAFLTIVCNYLD